MNSSRHPISELVDAELINEYVRLYVDGDMNDRISSFYVPSIKLAVPSVFMGELGELRNE
jgi:hypothetical protein